MDNKSVTNITNISSNAPIPFLQFIINFVAAFRAYGAGTISIIGATTSFISLLVFALNKGWPGNSRIYFTSMNVFALYFFIMYCFNYFIADGLTYLKVPHFTLELVYLIDQDFMCKWVNVSECMLDFYFSSFENIKMYFASKFVLLNITFPQVDPSHFSCIIYRRCQGGTHGTFPGPKLKKLL